MLKLQLSIIVLWNACNSSKYWR